MTGAQGFSGVFMLSIVVPARWIARRPSSRALLPGVWPGEIALISCANPDWGDPPEAPMGLGFSPKSAD
jgi:hypothetical protein